MNTLISIFPTSNNNPQLIQSETLEQIQAKQQLRRLEMYENELQPDYAIRRDDGALQVRGVIVMNGRCRAYNAYGDMMQLDPSQCKYYTQETGRVFKSTQQGETNYTDSHPLDNFSDTQQAPTFTNDLQQVQEQGGGVIDNVTTIANPMLPD